MSNHTILTEVEVRFVPVGLIEQETAYPTLKIDFSFTPGCPEQGPSYASGGEPATAAEIEITGVKLLDGDGLLPTDDQLREWADKWLDGDGYNEACDQAETDLRPDPDEAYEAMRDDAAFFDADFVDAGD
jgi:hypothetical protein